MTTRSNLAELLADPGSSAPAIVATSPLAIVSYKALAGQIERLSGQLRGAGLKPGDSVAIVPLSKRAPDWGVPLNEWR